MDFDFAAVMVLLVAVTGVIWAMDHWWWAPHRRARLEGLRQEKGGEVDADKIAAILKEPTIVEYARSFFPVILIVLLLRSFLVEPFRIPSGSMMPTLLAGDFILVNKFAYGIRLPVINTKILAIGAPQRGDVVVFRYPNDPSIDYIKRVIGLPGDRIGYYDKVLYVNGERIQYESLGKYIGVGSGVTMSGVNVMQEDLAEVKHQILIDDHKGTVEGDFVVPQGSYFAMGDNRDNSNDSRYWGTVPEANLVGRAFLIWMSWDGANGGISWGRIGNIIK